MNFNFISRLWLKLSGDSSLISLENKAFNAISILSLIILVILLPVNIYLRLRGTCILIFIVVVLLSVMYYYSRFKNKYRYSMGLYALFSYLLLVLNYFFNSGSIGPTIYLFLFTFQLLIAFTKRSWHLTWTGLHLLIISSLMGVEYYYPNYIDFTYKNHFERFFDLNSSIIIILVCMYIITIYLRNNYNKEKHIAQEHALKIQEQHQQISEQNEQLLSLNREKNKIISVLAHDLKGPLNAITSVLELLARYPVSDQRREELYDNLLQTTRNTSTMLGNLLSWSSNQMNGLRVSLGQVGLQEIVVIALQSQQPIADNKSIQIRVSIEPETYMYADSSLLELAIRNVISNAIKFTPENGNIYISSWQQGRTHILSIQDSGIGITPNQLEKIFSLDIHSSFGTNNEKGIGLGLVLCKEFIEMQHGSIEVFSSLGNGSTFNIALPVYQI